jgi:hypothetical protein
MRELCVAFRRVLRSAVCCVPLCVAFHSPACSRIPPRVTGALMISRPGQIPTGSQIDHCL